MRRVFFLFACTWIACGVSETGGTDAGDASTTPDVTVHDSSVQDSPVQDSPVQEAAAVDATSDVASEAALSDAGLDAPEDVAVDAPLVCDSGTACDGGCVDLNTDTNNCGSCGAVCFGANATMFCSSSHCAIGVCAQGFADCDLFVTNGCEVNTNTDAKHCGSCQKVCLQNQICVNGQCQ